MKHKKKLSGKLEVTRASNTTATIKGAVNLSHLHVYNLDPKLTIDDVSGYLKSKSIDEVQCEQLKNKYPERYSPFRVSFPSRYFEKVMKPDFWPQDACVNRFLFRLAKKKEIK